MATPKIDPGEFRRALGQLPTGVTVVTTSGQQGPSGATASAVTSLSLDPMLILACLDRGSRTLAAARAAGRFAVNVLAADQADLARRFASKDSGMEKWDGVEWNERSGLPAIAGVLAWVACDLRDLVEGGDHVIATGEVVDLDLAADEPQPLIHHRGAYRSLGAEPPVA